MEEKILIKDHENYHLLDDKRFMIGTTDPKILSALPEKKKLSLKNCQAIERGYDLDELALQMRIQEEPQIKANKSKIHGIESSLHFQVGVKKGFQKALEILGDKKFSEAIELIKYLVDRVEEGTIRSKVTYSKYKNFLQSLQQTEWKVEIITFKTGDIKIHNGNKNIQYEHNELFDPLEYKTDSEGCLILKRLIN